MQRRHLLTLAGAAALSAGAARSASAQTVASGARILVGFAPGAGPDLIARRLAEQLTGKLASAVVVENRSGAAGRIAVDAARALPADGLTLMLNPAGVVTLNSHTYRKLGYAPFDDLAPISLVCRYEFGFAVGPAVPESVKTLKDFMAWVPTQSTPVAFGSPAAGAPPHFVGDVLSRSRQLGLVHVPYRGAAPMLNDLAGGSVAAGVGSLGNLVEQAKGGRIRVLAATGPVRSTFYPSIPTFEELGVPGLTLREWQAVYIAGKPTPEVVARLVPMVRAAVGSTVFVKAMAEQGFEAVSSTPQELDALGRADHARWADIVKASGFVAES